MKRDDAGVPVEDEEEELPRMAKLLFPSMNFSQRRGISRTKIALVKGLLLFSSFPRSDFVEGRTSCEDELLPK